MNSYLESRQALLVLDNCEHLVDAAARVTHNLVGSCPGITVLTTSREALGLPGEVTFPVPPLSVPASDSLDLAAVAASESVALFCDRAALAGRGFTLTANNAATVAGICRRLDGIPLAIELAAARVRMLTVEQIRDRLDDCFGLLTAALAPQSRGTRRCGQRSIGAMTCCRLRSRRDSAGSESSPADSTSMLPSP